MERLAPSRSKISKILNTKIQTRRDPRGFQSACNFYRRHSKNFTYSSVILTEEQNKPAAQHLGLQEDKALNDLKLNLENFAKLVTPQTIVETVMITGASDTGSGARLFGKRFNGKHAIPK